MEQPMEQPQSGPQKKKIRDMSVDERRAYQRERKAASRSRQRAAREMTAIRNVAEYKIPEAWEVQLRAASQAADIAIRAELEQITDHDEYILTGISQVLHGLTNGYTQRVLNPIGIVVGTWFVDALGSEAVEYVHTNPVLLGSPTFREMYDEMLAEIVRWSKKQDPAFLTPLYVADVQAALAGQYQLPPEPNIPKPDPEGASASA